MSNDVFATNTPNTPKTINQASYLNAENITKQDIAQANNATTAALCTTGVLTGAACNTNPNGGEGNDTNNGKCCL